MSSNENYKDLAFLPIKYKKLYSYYKKQEDAFWFTREIDLSKDRQNWNTLSENVKRFLTFVLAFFAQADGLIMKNLVDNFQKETSETKEIAFFYNIQNHIELVHSDMYSLMIDEFIQEPVEKEKALNAIENYDSVKKMANWMLVWMDQSLPLMERVVAMACVEGIFFTSAFCAIYWIKRMNKLRGLCKANEFIARDEAIHTEFGIALYHHYTSVIKKYSILSQETIHFIVSSAVNVVSDFTKDALQVDLIDISSNEMIQYVQCCADNLVSSLGYEPIYNVENPFDWMIMINLPNKTNFFEDTVSEYQGQSNIDFTFTTDIEF